MSAFTVRIATPDDAERIAEIYGYYVKNTAITFEYVPPSADEMRRRIKSTLEKYPYLVAVRDGTVMGYAYAGAFITRSACDWSCEVTVYVDKTAKGQGVGRLLYETLENNLCKMGILNLYALVASPSVEDEYLTRNSEQFHAHLGFIKIGESHNCACKFGRWYNMIWMEKHLGTHCPSPSAPVHFRHDTEKHK